MSRPGGRATGYGDRTRTHPWQWLLVAWIAVDIPQIAEAVLDP
jgi:hypothetical protein